MTSLIATAALSAAAEAQGGGGAKPTPCELIPQGTNTRLRNDSIPGVGQVMFVGGGVLMKCPARGITLRGDSAERFPDHDQLIGHASFDDPRFHVTSDYLNYFPLEDKVVAVANVHARLPSGSTLDGPQAEYRRANPRLNRPRAQTSAIARPLITIVEKDSAGKPVPPMTVVANNVFVDGDSTNALIYAGGQVVINRPNISATADSAFIDQPKETMRLMRNPIVKGQKDKPFTLSGNLIDMYSKNKKVERVLARGSAKAVSDSMTMTSDTLDLRVRNDLLDHGYAWGATSRAHVVSPSQTMTADSLDVSMPGQRIRLVRALRRASAEGKPDTVRFIVEKPDTTDWIKGDTIVAHFDSLSAGDTTKNPAIKQLVALGHASALYHMAASDSAERRPALSYNTARNITIDLSKQKVTTVTTVDSIGGVFIDPLPDSTARRAKAAATAKAPAKTPAKTPLKPTVPSVVPLPSRPPTRP